MTYFSRRTLEVLKIIGGLSRAPVPLLLKGTVGIRQGLKVGTQDLSLLQMSRWLETQPKMCRRLKYACSIPTFEALR